MPGLTGRNLTYMIRIMSKLEHGAVVADLHAVSKADLMAQLANIASKSYALDQQAVLEGLEERERLGPTGFGGGTAIPHCKIGGIERPVAVFVRLA